MDFVIIVLINVKLDFCELASNIRHCFNLQCIQYVLAAFSMEIFLLVKAKINFSHVIIESID